MNISGTTVSATGHKEGLGDGLYDRAGARPDLDLDFARTKSLKDRVSKEDLITFSRTSGETGYGATYVDENGLVKISPVNLYNYSEDFSNSYWTTTNLTVDTTQYLAPNGSMTADKISTNDNVNNASFILYRSFSTNPVPANSYVSIYAKAAGRNFIKIILQRGGSCDFVNFDLVNGVVHDELNATGEMIDVGNGWYRCILKNNTGVGYFTVFQVNNGVLQSSGQLSNLGRETYNTAGQTPGVGIFVWGAMYSKQSGDYIKTTTQPSGAPRFTHDPETLESKGLLIEQQSTNLLTYSQDFSNSVWLKDNVTLDSNTTETTAPDGTNTATKLTTTSDSDVHRIKVVNFPLNQNQYTYSIWVKANTGNHVLLKIYKGSSGGNPASGNLLYRRVKINSDGTTTISGNEGTIVIEKYPNGWYKLIGTTKVDPQSATANSSIILNVLQNDANGESFAGSGESIYVWGAQLEQSTFGTSYIPTSGSTVTRSPDLASIEGDNFGTYRKNLVPKTESKSVFGVPANLKYTDYAVKSPDGNYNATLFTEDATSNQHILTLVPSPALANNTNYTLSCHFKEPSTNSRRYAGLTMNGRAYVIFDIQTGTHVLTQGSGLVSESITPVGDGWYRCSATITTKTSGQENRVYALLHQDGQTNGQTYTGDGTKGMYVWGYQCEEGNTLTPYIPSTDTYTSRQSDATFVDGNGVVKVAPVNMVVNSEDLSSSVYEIKGNNMGSRFYPVPPFTNPNGGSVGLYKGAGQTGLHGLEIRISGNNSNHNLKPNTQYVFSVFIKRIQGDSVERYVTLDPVDFDSFADGARGHSGVFDLETGTRITNPFSGVTSGIENIGDGWYRIYFVQTTSSSVDNLAGFAIINVDSNGFSLLQTLTNQQGYLVWGAQVVKGTEIGDYYKTTGTPSGPPRYSHDPETLTPTGLYLEAKTTNDAIDTERLGATGSGMDTSEVYIAGPYHYSNSTRKTETGITNPDGSTDGTTVLTVNSGTHNRQQPRGFRLPNIASLNGRSVQSVFVKRKSSTARYVVLFLGGTGTYQQCLFDFDTETVVENAAPHNLPDHQQYNATDRMVERGVVKYPNGWYRLYLIIDTPAVIAGNGYGVGLAKNLTSSKSANQSDDGPYDGTEAIYVWGLNRCSAEDVDSNNVPQQTHLSSYIKNLQATTSEVTRTPDIFTSTATEVLDRANGTKPAFYTTDGISLFVNGQLSNPHDDESHRYNNLVNFSTNHFRLEVAGVLSNKVRMRHNDESGSTDITGNSAPSNGFDTTKPFKAASRHKASDSRVAVHGVLGNQATGNSALRSSTALGIGQKVDGSRHLNGTINRIAIWKTPFVDSKLEKITQIIT